jgi:Zn-dependent protease
VPFVTALALVVTLFGCVLLHELGHSLAALYYRVPVRQITLYPIGGVAGLASMPTNPKKELVITIAGPLVNFILAPLFGLGYLFFTVVFPLGIAADLLAALGIVNVFLGLFNLLPGFPMDGGRILRAILASRMPHARATRIAVRVGQVTAVLMGTAALVFFKPMLLAISVFIFFAAQGELTASRLREQAARFNPESLFGRGAADPLFRPGIHPPSSSSPNPHREGETFVIEVRPDGSFRRRS